MPHAACRMRCALCIVSAAADVRCALRVEHCALRVEFIPTKAGRCASRIYITVTNFKLYELFTREAKSPFVDYFTKGFALQDTLYSCISECYTELQ